MRLTEYRIMHAAYTPEFSRAASPIDHSLTIGANDLNWGEAYEVTLMPPSFQIYNRLDWYSGMKTAPKI
jgi:hypothetical protein